MKEPITIDPKHTAVVSLDYQSGILGMVPDPQGLLARAAAVLEAARRHALRAIYVKVEFRPGHPEIHPRNVAMVERVKKNGLFLPGAQEGRIHASVAPEDTDIVVPKRRIGAFSGTELELVLRSLGVDTLILFGISTSGAVLTTVRQAFDADYRLIVPRDCCADPDIELHAMLMEKVIGRQARLTTAEETVAALA